MIKKYLTYLILFFLSIYSISAQSVKFEAETAKNIVEVSEQFRVTFRLSNATGSNFRKPFFGGLGIVSGPIHGVSKQIINGVSSGSEYYSYILSANRLGDYTIGPALIFANNMALSTNSIKIKVVKATHSPNVQNFSQNSSSSPSISKGNNIFIDLNISKKDIYVGEQIVATYTLYYSPGIQIQNVTSADNPTFDGFWQEDINLSQTYVSSKQVGGVQYYSQDLKKVILVPQKSGEITIEPLKINYLLDVPVQQGWFTTYSTVSRSVSSGSQTLTVKPFPDVVSQDFSGISGKLNIDASIDNQETGKNEPIKLKVTITGQAAIKLINAPKLELPDGFENFDPIVSDNINLTPEGFEGSRSFEYMIIPRKIGKFDIPPVKFCYFDIDQNKFITLETEKIKVSVKDNGKISSDNDSYTMRDNSNNSSGKWYILWYIFAAIGCAALLYLFYKLIRNNKIKRFLVKRKKEETAEQNARKRLAKSAKLISVGNPSLFYDEASSILWQYICEKLNLQNVEIMRDTLRYELTGHNVPQSDIEIILQTLDLCDFARFAPAAMDIHPNQIYDRIEEIIEILYPISTIIK